MKNTLTPFILALACFSFFTGCATQAPNLNSHVSIAARAAAEKSIRISAVQFQIIGDHTPEQFFARVETYVKQAAEEKSVLVIFPELLTDDTWPSKTALKENEIAEQIAKKLTPLYFKKVIELSRQYQISILGGSAPRLVGKKVYNTAILAFPDGRVIYQNKIFPTGWELDQGWVPGDELQVFDAPWGRSVILICYDSEFPLISEKLSKLKPEWIFVPSMTNSNAGFHRVRWSAQARAVEHHAFVVLTGTVGTQGESTNHYGQAAFLEPWDKPFYGLIHEGPQNTPSLETADFNVEALRENRKKTRYYPSKTETGRKILLKHISSSRK